MPKERMTQDVEKGTKTGPSSTPSQSPPGKNEERRPAVLKVQLKLPTNVLNLSGSLNQISSLQAKLVIVPEGVLASSLDPRVGRTTLIPWGSIKAIDYEAL